MLGKLLKHEFKNSYFEILITNIVFVVLSLFVAVTLTSRSAVILILSLTTLFIVIIALFVILIYNIIKSFNKKMFTSEGYLTFTLPVSVDSLIISKLICNIVLYFFTVLCVAFGFFIILAVNIDFDNLVKIFKEILQIINILPLLIRAIAFAFQLILTLLILLFALALLNAGKIRRHKMLVGFAVFFGIALIFNWVSNLFVVLPYGLHYFDGFNIVHFEDYHGLAGLDIYIVLNFNKLFWTLLFIPGLYFLSRNLIYKHLELE